MTFVFHFDQLPLVRRVMRRLPALVQLVLDIKSFLYEGGSYKLEPSCVKVTVSHLCFHTPYSRSHNRGTATREASRKERRHMRILGWSKLAWKMGVRPRYMEDLEKRKKK